MAWILAELLAIIFISMNWLTYEVIEIILGTITVLLGV